MPKKKKEIIAINEKSVSHSSIKEFQSCRRRFWFRYIRGYTYKFMQIKFVVGNFYHTGLMHLYKKTKNPIDITIKEYTAALKTWRKKSLIMQNQEQEFIRQEAIIHGMLKAYAEKYRVHIKKSKHKGNEVKLELITKAGYKIVAYVDNILKIEGKQYIHEIKSSKYLNEDYINAIKNDFQSSLYKYMYNQTHPKTDQIEGVLYDVIQKPSIRLKQKETEAQFLERLFEYYICRSNDELFYMEKIKRPLIKNKNILNVINQTTKDIVSCKQEDDYYPNYSYCNIWGKCEYYYMCFNGENQSTLANFTTQKRRY